MISGGRISRGGTTPACTRYWEADIVFVTPGLLALGAASERMTEDPYKQLFRQWELTLR